MPACRDAQKGVQHGVLITVAEGIKGSSLVGAHDNRGDEAGFPDQVQAVALPICQCSHHRLMVLPRKQHCRLATLLQQTAQHLHGHQYYCIKIQTYFSL